mmetsp:Transcript_9089/g.20544  ORF Transcript_9089/g.20544 Transcript_9089/m.20544 type:complete len:410 (-) Transcript_9089:135-1364(-)|eukprot:CAMPEP_0172321634 /NCGR_PEP_ID=MMETSP1058-20130122/43920_1 /TAXON_ID=83371 /ORGANISM="Detonula confervacea, Strain CCMP 353" /LENGTH=409 /DNA_ID=CAMNT_0013037201 /DNA_START=73 /DNA_END=1302 /DNA_ORIENTATION=+
MYLQTKEEIAQKLAARQLGHHCPPGYAGDDCSIKVTDCAAERTDLVDSCYYGSSCVDASNEFGLLDRYCECDKAGELAAGLMCQYKATSMCTTEDAEEQVTDQYCVNGGVCVAFVGAEDSHPGCICETGKWEGKHCEFAHGVLLDDALDLFQQRKTEIAIERLGDSGDLRPTIILDDEGEKQGIPLLIGVGSFVAIFAMIAVWRPRKHQQKSKDTDYQSIGLGSVASKSTYTSKSTYESSLPPPADVFLASRKKEVELDDESAFIVSPGNDAHEDDTNDVEMLDAETSRMIEAQFESCGMNNGEESEEESGEELVFAPSYESDNGNIDQDSRLHSGRITINSGKNPLSKLQHESRSDDGINGLIDVDEMVIYENEESIGLDAHVNHGTNGVTSLDGESDDDSDEDTYFV